MNDCVPWSVANVLEMTDPATADVGRCILGGRWGVCWESNKVVELNDEDEVVVVFQSHRRRCQDVGALPSRLAMKSGLPAMIVEEDHQ